MEKDFSFGIESLEQKLDELSDRKTQEQVEDFIKSEKNKAKNRVYNQVEIGMDKEKVVELMGEPDFIEDKYSGKEIKQLWFYFDNIEKIYVKFYFEDNILKRINN